MELKELIERLELVYGCLIGSNVSGITPINQFESIINDLKKVKKLTIPDVSQCNEQVCTLHRYCEYQSGLGKCAYLSQCDYKKQTCG